MITWVLCRDSLQTEIPPHIIHQEIIVITRGVGGDIDVSP